MRRRLTRRQKGKRNKQIIMISTICLLFVMVIGYAAFSTSLSLKAKGNILSSGMTKPVFEHYGIDEQYSGYVLITFPEGCDEKYTCSFTKDGFKVPVRSTVAWVYLGGTGGNITAEVSDGKKTLSDSAVYSAIERYPTISCISFNSCDVAYGLETIDFENSNSYLFNTYFEYPNEMLDDFNAMKADRDNFPEDEIQSILDKDNVIPFALYNFDHVEANSDGLYEIKIDVSQLLENNTNINILYYSQRNSYPTLVTIDSVDWEKQTIEFTVEDLNLGGYTIFFLTMDQL